MQKTAYEMRMSDWSSDVCSSDLRRRLRMPERYPGGLEILAPGHPAAQRDPHRHVQLVLQASQWFVVRQTTAPVADTQFAVLLQFVAARIHHHARIAPRAIQRLDRKSTRLNSSH